MSLTAGLMLALLAAPPGGSTAPLAPSTPWHVIYGESNCIAGRVYGTGKDKVTLVFQPSLVGGVMQLILVQTGRHVQPEQQRADLTVSGGQRFGVSAMTYSIKETGQRITRMNLRSEDFGRLHDGPLGIRIEGHDMFDLPLTKLAGIKQELGKCAADLTHYWQMGPSQLARVKQPAQPVKPLSSYFSSDDYPAQALLEQNTGTVGVRLMIDEKGVVQDCSPAVTSGSSVLDMMTCIILARRAKYRPAVDVDGKAMKSFIDTGVGWRL